MVRLEELYPMYREYNKKFGYKIQFKNNARTRLVEKCLEKMTLKELKDIVLEKGGWIDDTLRDIINGQIKLETVAEVAVKETEGETKMESTVGNELQTLLIDTIAKYSVEKVMDSIMPSVRQKVIDEFGVLPVTHEVKVGDKEPIKMDGELPPVFDKILAYAVNGNPVMMTGPSGTGKGFLARQVAKACGADFYEVNAVKNNYELTGFLDANSNYNKTPFYDACKTVAEGGKAVFLFDEMDCSDPESLKVFNEALEAREFTFPNNEKLEFENLIIISACNTFGTGADEVYCGQQLDASTLNRFVLIKVDYNRKVEVKLARGDEELVDFIDMFRSQTEKNGLTVVISYRNIKQIASMKGILPLKEVMKDCLVKSIANDDLRNILENLDVVMSDNIYYRACKGENVKVA